MPVDLRYNKSVKDTIPTFCNVYLETMYEQTGNIKRAYLCETGLDER